MTDLRELAEERAWRAMKRQRDATVEENAEAFERFAAQTKIRVPGKGRIPFLLRDPQKAVVRQWLTHRYCLDLKARQVGWSTLGAVFVLWSAISLDDWFCALLSKGERESIKLLAKSKLAYKSLPPWVKDRAPKPLDNNLQKLSFDNASEIESLPAGNEPARGDALDLIFLDEWAFLPNPEAAWASTEPVTDIGGSAIAISTANGSGNLFHQTWLDSQLGENQWNGLFFPWSAVPERDEQWYEAKKRSYKRNPHLFFQEYPSSPEEAFLKSGKNVFDMDRIMEMQPRPASIRGSIVWPDGPPTFIPDPDGELHVWEPPQEDEKHRTRTYVIGADIARGLAHGDASVAWVLRADTQEPVAVWHGRVDPDLFGEKVLKWLGDWYHGALEAPENNTFGLSTIKALQRVGYKNIYRSRSIKHRTEQKIETLGWSTSSTSKPVMIAELAAWLRDHEVPDHHTITELKTYLYDDKGHMNGSPFDDRVIALAIAVQMLKYAFMRQYKAEAPATAGTYGAYERQWREQERKEDRQLLVLGGASRRRSA